MENSWIKLGNKRSLIQNDIWSSAKNYHNFLINKTNNERSVLKLNTFFENFFVKEKNKLLELGCGMGWLSAFLKNKYQNKISNIDLLDIDFNFKKHTKEMFKIYNASYDNVNFFELNFSQIDTLKNSYDLILLTSSIHHYYDLYDLLSSIKKILNKDGYLIILNENPISRSRFTWELLKNYIHDFYSHLFSNKYKRFKQISHCGIKYDPILGDYIFPLDRYKFCFKNLGYKYEICDSKYEQYRDRKLGHTLKHFICQIK